MFIITSLEKNLLYLFKDTVQLLTWDEINTNFENKSQAEKAIEGCIAKKFIQQIETNNSFKITEDGKHQL